LADRPRGRGRGDGDAGCNVEARRSRAPPAHRWRQDLPGRPNGLTRRSNRRSVSRH